MDLPDFRRLADIIAGLGIGEIDVLGGEPTLHPHISDIISIACEKGLTVTMSTNGTDVPALEMLWGLFGQKRFRLGISLNDEPVPPRLHDFIVTAKPMLKSVCTAAGTIPAAARPYLDDPHIACYLLFMDTPFRGDLAESMSFPRYREILREMQISHPSLRGVSCSGFIPDTGEYPHLASLRCPAGTTKISVLPDGSVYPCYLLVRHRQYRLGNIFSDPFEAIWNNPVLLFFRTFEGNRCPDTECLFHAACHGGCPAHALLIGGDITGPDPRCMK